MINMHGNDQKRFEINAVADKTLIADLSDSRRKILFMLRSDSNPKIVVVPTICHAVPSVPVSTRIIPSAALVDSRAIVAVRSGCLNCCN